MVVMPRAFLHAMNLLRGDYVELTLDESTPDRFGRPTVRISALYQREIKPEMKTAPQGVQEIQG